MTCNLLAAGFATCSTISATTALPMKKSSALSKRNCCIRRPPLNSRENDDQSSGNLDPRSHQVLRRRNGGPRLESFRRKEPYHRVSRAKRRRQKHYHKNAARNGPAHLWRRRRPRKAHLQRQREL